MMKKMKAIIGAVITLFLLGFGIGTDSPTPPNALVFVDTANKTYLSFPCLAEHKDLRFIRFDESAPDKPKEEGNISQRQIAQYRDAGTRFTIQTGSTPETMRTYATLSYSSLGGLKNALGEMNLDPECRNNGGFMQEGRSASGRLLERVGLPSPLKSRWNSDGTWNW